MKDSRKGECLWTEWYGDGYSPCSTSTTTIVFYTEDHVDLENELVKRALASAIQRDGIVDSLGDAFKRIDGVQPHCGYVGNVDGSREKTVCDSSGETELGDIVDAVHKAMWVEIA
jgi:hypothetical protein